MNFNMVVYFWFSHSVMSDFLQPHGLQHSRPPCLSPTPRVYPNSCPLSQWCHPTISSSVIPFSSCLLFFSPSGSFKMSWLFTSGGHSNGASDSASVLWIFGVDFMYNWLVWFPCSPKDSQESFPTPQFKSINALMLSLLYGPSLTFIHDYWKNHSFDKTNLCCQSSVSAL